MSEHLRGRGSWISKFETSLVYRADSQRHTNPFSKKPSAIDDDDDDDDDGDDDGGGGGDDDRCWLVFRDGSSMELGRSLIQWFL